MNLRWIALCAVVFMTPKRSFESTLVFGIQLFRRGGELRSALAIFYFRDQRERGKTIG